MPPLSEEDIAHSARVRREARNRFGMVFREWLVEGHERILERNGSWEAPLEPVVPNSTWERLKSRVLALTDFRPLRVEPVPALGGPSHETDIRRIPLGDVFGVTEEELEQGLAWCGPFVEIARTFPEVEGRPVYSVYASEATRELGGHTELGNCLVITLKGPNEERCTARLNAKQTAAIFEGDELTGKLELISVELVILRE